MLRFAILFRFLVAWVLLLLLLLQTAHATTTPPQQESDGDNGEHVVVDVEGGEERWAEFKTWAERHERKYESQMEEAKRFTIWMENDDNIKKHNSQIPPPSWTMAHNDFSDLTHKEFTAAVGLIELPSDHYHRALLEEQIIDSNVTIEEVNPNLRSSRRLAVDWRSQVIVKNQGSCGSCWAFSTTGAIEAFYKIRKGQTINLAEQHLVDCSKGGNYGCNGGWPSKALTWVASNGISAQSSYAYTGRDGTCKAATGTYKISGPRTISASSSALQTALNSYPVSVCVDATNWAYYGGGVFSGCGSSLNHAVLAVGYDANGNWLIKNSWGTSWGEKGFITLQAGNTCGVLNAAVMAF